MAGQGNTSSWELTYPLPFGTFESMLFLFPRWDVLVPWRVSLYKDVASASNEKLKHSFWDSQPVTMSVSSHEWRISNLTTEVAITGMLFQNGGADSGEFWNVGF